MLKLKTGFKKTLSLFLGILFLFTIIVLSVDSIRGSDTIKKYLFVNSAGFLICFLLINLSLRILWNVKIPAIFNKLNTYLILTISACLSIVLTFINYLNTENYVYSRLLINFQQLGVLAIGSATVALINAKESFLIRRHKLLIFISGPVLLFALWIIRLWPYDYFANIVKEDHLIEYSQFFAVLLSSLAALFVSFKTRKLSKLISILYLLGALALFFVAGDEISWGQRILKISTPSYMTEINAQEEINIHNLNIFISYISYIYIFVGIYGSLFWVIASKLTKSFPLLVWITPQKELFFYFFAGFLYNLYALIGQNYNLPFIGEWSEVAELMLNLGILLFILGLVVKLRNKAS